MDFLNCWCETLKYIPVIKIHVHVATPKTVFGNGGICTHLTTSYNMNIPETDDQCKSTLNHSFSMCSVCTGH